MGASQVRLRARFMLVRPQGDYLARERRHQLVGARVRTQSARAVSQLAGLGALGVRSHARVRLL